jgi:hypothetical protein
MAYFKMAIKVFQLSAVGYSAQEHEKKKMRRERISVKIPNIRAQVHLHHMWSSERYSVARGA